MCILNVCLIVLRVFSAPRSGLAHKHFIDVGGEFLISTDTFLPQVNCGKGEDLSPKGLFTIVNIYLLVQRVLI